MTTLPTGSDDFSSGSQPVTGKGGRGPADPGFPRPALLAWMAAVLLIGMIFVSNQKAISSASSASLPASVGGGTDVEPFVIIGKAFVKVAHRNSSPKERADAFQTFLEQAPTKDATQEVQTAVVAGELVGAGAAVKRLDNVKDLNEDLGKDVALLRRAYAAGNAGALAEADRQTLINDLGWFGRLAATYGLPDTDPVRAPLLEGGAAFIALAIGAVVLVGVLAVGGVAASITMVVLIASRRIRPRFSPPSPGGSVYMEVVAMFAVGFIVFKLALGAITRALAGPDGTVPGWLEPASLVSMWLLAPVLLWPRVRGVSWAQLRRDMGWTCGEGFLREVGCGVVGYLAGLPLVAFALVATLTLMAVRELFRHAGAGAPSGPARGEILELLGGENLIAFLALFLVGTVWAPLVEESVFRGAFFRHLRSRLGVLGAAAVSALAFGLMHPLAVYQMLPVMTLGFVFALMRSWRGSLVASMTAHSLNNAMILGIMHLLLRLLRG